MRKFLMMTVLAGSAALGLGTSAEAAPTAGPLTSLAVAQPAQVQAIQYRCGPRCREEIRRREFRRRHYDRRHY